MYLKINKKECSNTSNKITFEEYSVHYSLEQKTFFFESETLVLFLKTNYPESYIDTIFSEPKKVTIASVKGAFNKDGVWVIIDKQTKEISLNRDISGLGAVYFFADKESIHISTNVHNLAKHVSKALCKKSVYQLLFFDFLWDGQTIYDGVSQLKVGGNLILNASFETIVDTVSQPSITEQENNLSEEQNIKKLRDEIVKAHKHYTNSSNTVFLSGGIDSVAMLIALDDLVDKKRIENHSFKVKGTSQDETVYAKSIADHLGIELSIIERDISSEINKEVFEKEIFKMNNPYPGMWVIGNQVKNESFKTYFAGQDTRLHTPSLNRLDAIAFNIFSLSKYLRLLFVIFDVVLYPLKKLFDTILKKKTITNKYFLGLRRTLYLFNTKAYINLVYFKVDKAMMRSYNYPMDYFDEVTKDYNISLKGIKDKRSLYNTIVSKKWIEQYVNDMRYMIDMVNNQGGKLAMPFYDMELAKFSATIPFELSIKSMKGKAQYGNKSSIIHKYVLRESLKDKIDEKTYLRSKAVSRTGHIMFKQSLDKVLKTIIKEDLESQKSFVKEYKLEGFIDRFLKTNKENWIMTDDKYLLKVYYIATTIVYQQKILKQ